LRSGVAIAAVTALAAALRIAGLDAKGFWEDEATSIALLRMDFFEMLSALPESERTPPLYYLLAWPWTQLFGHGEVGIRSLSVLIGTATVPVSYLAARELVSRRAGTVVAVLVAVNPILVWYSQEGRAYALLVLTAAAALLFFVRALRDPESKWLGLWALSSVLAIASHYFAAFLFLAEAAWLLAARGYSLRLAIAVGVPVAAGLALSPLAIAQADTHAGIDWIPAISLAQRAVETPGFFVVGFEVSYPLAVGLAALAAGLAAAGLVLLLRRADEAEKRGALTAGSVAAAGLVLPLALAVAGIDFFVYKNLLGTLVPFAIVIGAGLGAARAGSLGIALTAGLALLSIGIVASTASDPKYQRESWREAAEALGVPKEDRAIVATPGAPGREPLLHAYLRQARELEAGRALVGEIDVLALPRRRLGAIANPELPDLERPVRPPAPGYELVDSRRTGEFLLLRYRAPTPRWLSHDQLASAAADPGVQPVVLVESGRPIG